MNWTNASKDNPGKSVYHAGNGDHLYVIHMTRGGSGYWRVAHRFSSDKPLSIIYIGDTLKESKQYAEEHAALFSFGEES